MDFNAQYGISISPVGLAGNAARVYTDKVQEHLTWIYRTKMGRILLASIKFHAKPVIIQPYTGTDCNSSGGWKTVGGAVQGTVSYSPDTFSLHGACPVNKAAANARRNSDGRGMIQPSIERISRSGKGRRQVRSI